MRKFTASVGLAATSLTLSMIVMSGSIASADGEPEARVTTKRAANGLEITTTRIGKDKLVTYGAAPKNVRVKKTSNKKSVITFTPGKTKKLQQVLSVYEMSIASGMSHKDACEFAEGMDPYGCQSAATWRASSPRSVLARAQSPLDTACFDHVSYKGDGSKHAHACRTRYLDYSGSSYKLIGAKMKTSAWTVKPGILNDRIDGVGIKLNYSSDSSYAVDWSPVASRTVGRCNSVTTTATSPRSGISYSSTTEVCPESLNPWHSPAFQNFGAKWKGEAAATDETRGAVASSVQRIASGQTSAVAIDSWLSWS